MSTHIRTGRAHGDFAGRVISGSLQLLKHSTFGLAVFAGAL
jgi:hypothetical protein